VVAGALIAFPKLNFKTIAILKLRETSKLRNRTTRRIDPNRVVLLAHGVRSDLRAFRDVRGAGHLRTSAVNSEFPVVKEAPYVFSNDGPSP
jgi:hypothetical protein